jgi:hypothetical protein
VGVTSDRGRTWGCRHHEATKWATKHPRTARRLTRMAAPAKIPVELMLYLLFML